MNKIEVGKKYYMNLYGLCPWEIMTETETMHYDPEVYESKVVRVNTTNNLYDKKFNFIEVTYRGNGVFYESLTKTKILVTEAPYNCELEDFNDSMVTKAYLDLDDYITISKQIHNKDVDINMFFEANKKIRETIARASLVYDTNGYKIYQKNAENENIYKTLPNNERINIMIDLCNEAEISKYRTILELNNAYNIFIKPSDELIKQAYKENEEYNLTLKSKARKDSK